MAPDTVLRTRELLAEKLGRKVGTALDCCSDPAYQLGDLETTRETALSIGTRVEQAGITHVITGCVNCVKVLRRYLRGVKVEHVLEVLPEAAVPAGIGGTVYLHHPCPSHCFESIQNGARRQCKSLGSAVVEQTRPLCCGQGGGLPALSPELADACTGEILHAAEKMPLVTYCMGCKDRFLRQGKRAYHILELLVSGRPADRPVSSLRKWINRLVLALKLKWLKDAA
jgi:Fe-S oxidoreductase